MRKPIIGVMGPGADATETDKRNAFKLGRLIAEKGWILLNGGMNKGVMDEVNKGAKAANGLTIGVIATKSKADISDAVDIPIITNMGSARNYINILTSDVIIACGMSPGTASEVSMALFENKFAPKYIILLTNNKEGDVFFKNLNPERVLVVSTPQEAIDQVEKLI